MDKIKQALERARGLKSGNAGQNDFAPNLTPEPFESKFDVREPVSRREQTPSQEIELDVRHLESNRIIAHDDSDFRSKSFDMLRTQVLQSMDKRNWKILGITSPSPGCGKSVTAINLALSIARQPERSALLVDLDLRKPHVAKYLGLNCRKGLFDVLEERISLSGAIIQARVAGYSIMALPAETSTSDSSAWMTSRAMTAMLQEIKRDFQSHTVILDLPPMLSSDDVIAVLPQLDCILLVAAVGKTTAAEITECNKHLRSTDVVRLVLNKVPNLNPGYYPDYGSERRAN